MKKYPLIIITILLTLSCSKQDFEPCDKTTLTVHKGRNVKIETFNLGYIVMSEVLENGGSIEITNSAIDSISITTTVAQRVEIYTNDCKILENDTITLN